jgi:hypothetical protein
MGNVCVNINSVGGLADGLGSFRCVVVGGLTRGECDAWLSR